MVSDEPFASPLGAYAAAPVVALDADFNLRWDAWVARGRVHDQRVRRQVLLGAGALSAGAALLYAFLRT